MLKWIAVLDKNGHLKPGVHQRDVLVDTAKKVAYLRGTGKTAGVVPLLYCFDTEEKAKQCFAAGGVVRWYFVLDQDSELVVGHGKVARGFMRGVMTTYLENPPKGIGHHPYGLMTFETEQACMEAWRAVLLRLEQEQKKSIERSTARLRKIQSALKATRPGKRA